MSLNLWFEGRTYEQISEDERPDSAILNLHKDCLCMKEMIFKKDAKIDEQSAEIERLQNLAERLKQEAEIHAQEARTQRATVHSIYQALSIQKGDWNGSEPVIEVFGKLKQERDQLRAEIMIYEAVRTQCVIFNTPRVQREDSSGVSMMMVPRCRHVLRVAYRKPCAILKNCVPALRK